MQPEGNHNDAIEGDEAAKMLQLKFGSASNSAVFLLKNFHPVDGGWLPPTLATLATAVGAPFCPSNHSSPDLWKGERLSEQIVVFVLTDLL